MGLSQTRTHDIEEMVYAVTQIDIGNAAFAIECLCPIGTPATIGMRRLVLYAKIGFGFYDYACRYLSINLGKKHFSQKVFG
ncbi:hypothetical protein D3C86_1200560 [compost metagenome]